MLRCQVNSLEAKVMEKQRMYSGRRVYGPFRDKIEVPLSVPGSSSSVMEKGGPPPKSKGKSFFERTHSLRCEQRSCHTEDTPSREGEARILILGDLTIRNIERCVCDECLVQRW